LRPGALDRVRVFRRLGNGRVIGIIGDWIRASSDRSAGRLTRAAYSAVTGARR